MTAPVIHRPAAGWSSWPKFLTGQQRKLFTDNGWTADDWLDADRQAAVLDGPTAWPNVVIGPRYTYNLREWLRNPPEVLAIPITPALVRETLAVFAHMAPNALNAYADGASHRFVVAALDSNKQDWFLTTFLQSKPDMAWNSALHSGLSEAEALGWALTGGLTDKPSLAGELGDDLTRRLINPWTDLFGPTAYLYVLAGYTLQEAGALKKNGAQVSAQQLRVMVALAGVVLPEGV